MICAQCEKPLGVDNWKLHLNGECRYDRYAAWEIRVRAFMQGGMSARKAVRQAMIDLGYVQPPPPMPEEVKVMLRDRARAKVVRLARIREERG